LLIVHGGIPYRSGGWIILAQEACKCSRRHQSRLVSLHKKVDRPGAPGAVYFLPGGARLLIGRRPNIAYPMQEGIQVPVCGHGGFVHALKVGRLMRQIEVVAELVAKQLDLL
jgi:hypothetical protein